MFRKLLLAGFALTITAGLAQAEPMRPFLTKENRFPELRHADIGFRYTFIEQEDDNAGFLGGETNLNAYTPYVRFRPTGRSQAGS